MNMQHTQRTGEDLFGRAIASRLAAAEQELPHDISERLRAARVQAVAKRRVQSSQVAADAQVSGGEVSLPFNSNESGWRVWLMAFMPLLLLVVGLLSIGVLQDDLFADEVAAVDSELLTDELPPAAYTDPGFAQFLRSRQAN